MQNVYPAISPLQELANVEDLFKTDNKLVPGPMVYQKSVMNHLSSRVPRQLHSTKIPKKGNHWFIRPSIRLDTNIRSNACSAVWYKNICIMCMETKTAQWVLSVYGNNQWKHARWLVMHVFYHLICTDFLLRSHKMRVKFKLYIQ